MAKLASSGSRHATVNDFNVVLSSEEHQQISSEKKLKIIELLEKGIPVPKLSKFYGVQECTIRFIGRNKEKIKCDIISSTNDTHSKVRIRDVDLVNMERLLLLWIDDKAEGQESLSSSTIKKKGVEIYEYLTQYRPNDHAEFLGSRQWYEKFKTQNELNLMVTTGSCAGAFDKYHQVANARLANLFIFDFNRFTEMERYSPDQIFCVKETKLFWKKMPGDVFVPAKDRMTVVLCSNMAATVKLKPFVVLIMDSNKPLHPNNCRCCVLPVRWYSTGTTWMNSAAFKEWLEKTFVPEVKSYCQRKNMPFRVLLLLGKAPSHQNLPEIPGLTVMYSPSKTDSIINPMNHGIINDFRIGYLKKTLEAMILPQPQTSPSDTWKHFGKGDAIDLIGQTWEWIPETTMRQAWAHISEKEEDNQARNLDNADEIEQILQLCKNVMVHSHSNMRTADIEEWFESHNKELSNEELSYLCGVFPSVFKYYTTPSHCKKVSADSEEWDIVDKNNMNKKGLSNNDEYEESNEFRDPTSEVESSPADIIDIDEEPQNQYDTMGNELSSLDEATVEPEYYGLLNVHHPTDESETPLETASDNEYVDIKIEQVEGEDTKQEVGCNYQSKVKDENVDESTDVIYSKADIPGSSWNELLSESEPAAKRMKLTQWKEIKLEPIDLEQFKREKSDEESEGDPEMLLNQSIKEEDCSCEIENQVDLYSGAVMEHHNRAAESKNNIYNYPQMKPLSVSSTGLPTTKNLQRLVKLMNTLIAKSRENDTNHTRRNQFINDVEDAMRPYKLLLNKKLRFKEPDT